MAKVGGVCVGEMTVDAHEPHQSMFPAPIVIESSPAKPTMVDVEPVQEAKVIAELL